MTSSHRPRIHRADIIHLRGAPGQAISLNDYIEAARSASAAADVVRLSGFRSQIEAKLQTEQARQHHDLHEGAETLLRFLASPDARAATDPLPTDIAEAVVALHYLLEGIDLIPDAIPEIGLTDDARLVARVLARNPSIL